MRYSTITKQASIIVEVVPNDNSGNMVIGEEHMVGVLENGDLVNIKIGASVTDSNVQTPRNESTQMSFSRDSKPVHLLVTDNGVLYYNNVKVLSVRLHSDFLGLALDSCVNPEDITGCLRSTKGLDFVSELNEQINDLIMIQSTHIDTDNKYKLETP